MHLRTHTKEKPLMCDICGKRFAESSNLAKHRRLHQERRFICDQPGCTKLFHRSDGLRRHLANVHGVKGG